MSGDSVSSFYMIFTNSAPLGRVCLVGAMSVLILSPCHAIFLGLSLANTGDMISSQASHCSMGAAVQQLNSRARSFSTIERPRPKSVKSPKSQRT